MNKLNVDVVVIGAGQAGLAMSYRLKNAGVLDRPEFRRHSVAALRVAPLKLYR